MREDYREFVEQVQRERERWLGSARKILGYVVPRFRPGSIVDVGCGVGLWLQAAMELEVRDVVGIDGEWLDPAKVVVPAENVVRMDLERPFSLGRRFDLALCLEVAEHLSPGAADGLVESLVRHANVVLFSAAVPHQGGPGHLNEQWPDWWAERFAAHGFAPLDLVRTRFWADRGVQHWYRQNTLLFAHDSVIRANEELSREARRPKTLSVVHPDLYDNYVRRLIALGNEHGKLAQMIAKGGTFNVTPRGNGAFDVRRMG